MRKIKNPKPNEFILVTKYSDHDPNDPWALGWFTRKGNWKDKITYYVKDEYGYESLYPKYRYCFRLTSDDIKHWISLIAKDWKLDFDTGDLKKYASRELFNVKLKDDE